MLATMQESWKKCGVDGCFCGVFACVWSLLIINWTFFFKEYSVYILIFPYSHLFLLFRGIFYALRFKTVMLLTSLQKLHFIQHAVNLSSTDPPSLWILIHIAMPVTGSTSVSRQYTIVIVSPVIASPHYYSQYPHHVCQLLHFTPV